jgi:tetratricopeptide (TPR) repeat protein
VSRSVYRANQAISRISDMPYGLARTQAAEQEARRIEAEGPPQALAYALSTLVDSMFWSGEVEESFVPFTRMVRWWDEHPEYFDSSDRHSLFWMFKWMVADLMEFPTVPAAQIEATITDMERRYAIEGFGMNAVMHQRFMWAEERESDEMDAAFEAWCTTPRDAFSQCESCEPGDRAAYLVSRGRMDEAIRIVELALTKSPSCASEPADMLSHLQLAYLAVGRHADGASAHRRALAHLRTSMGTMTGARGRCIQFLALCGNDDAALRRIETDQDLLVECDSPKDRLEFLQHVGTATHLVRAVDPDHKLTLGAVPATTVAELDEWARAQADRLAREFDERNGTDANARRVAAAWSVERDGTVLDMSVLRLHGEDAATTPPAAAVADTSGADTPTLAAPDAQVAGTSDAQASDAPDTQAPGAPDTQATGAPVAPDAPVAHDLGTPGAPDAPDPRALSTPDAPDTQASGTPDAPDRAKSLQARAEQAADSGDLEQAAPLFLAASRAAEDAGRTQEAGWSMADAAQSARLLTDHTSAVSAFARAIALLEAADTSPEETVRMLCEQAASAAETDRPLEVLPPIERAIAKLDLLIAEEPSPDVAPALAERALTTRRHARAELADVTARLHATVGEHALAAHEAEQAAEAFAGLSATADAAHAFWLAGRMHMTMADATSAVWHLESAVEGFTMANDANNRATVAGELIEALHAAGRHEEADGVTR